MINYVTWGVNVRVMRSCGTQQLQHRPKAATKRVRILHDFGINQLR